MSWEQPPQRVGRRRWRWPLAAVVVIVIVAGSALLVGNTSRDGVLTVARDDQRMAPTGAPTQEPVEAPDVSPETLQPLNVTSETLGSRPPLPQALPLSLLVVDFERVRTIDLTTGDLRVLGGQGGSTTYLDPWALSAIGNTVFTSDQGGSTVRVSPSGARTRFVDGHQPVLTFADDAMWVSDTRVDGQPYIWQVDLDGAVIDHVRLPAFAQPQAGLRTGVVTWSPGGLHLVSRDATRQITSDGQLAALGAGGELARVVCDADLRCEVVIGTIDDPDQHQLPLSTDEVTAGWFGSGPFGRFSPNGRWLALPVYTVGADTADRTDVRIIDVAAGAEVGRVETNPRTMYEPAGLAWAPDSRWLFLGGPGGLSAWNTDTNKTTVIGGFGAPAIAVVER